MQCFSCQAGYEIGGGERVGFHESCERCGADLHVCRNCGNHDLSAYNECQESSAERVTDRDRANSCEYFKPSPETGDDETGGRSEALSDLEALFKKS
jgi:hypothetical protein